MANYANLKATINANIKANGTEAITGPVLNSVLTAAVNTLGAGYQFMGVATTSTNPGTPDANVFYIAATPGTYTNFGGKTVADGEVAILKYNGTWTKEVTGAATAAQVTQLGQKVDELDEDLHPVFDTFNDGYINYVGAVDGSSNFRVSVPVYLPKGSSLTFVAAGYSTNVAMLARYEKESNLYFPIIVSADNNVHTFNYEVETSGYFVISYLYSQGISINLETPDVKESTALEEYELYSYKALFVDGKYITLNGGIGSVVSLSSSTWSSVYRYAVVPCKMGDTFIISGTGGDAPRLWAFLNSDNEIISVSSSGASATNLVITAPSGSAKVVFNDSVKTGDFIRIGLTEKVADVENEIFTLSTLPEEVSEISARYGGGTYTPTMGTPTSGKYVDSAGSVQSSSGFSISSLVFVPIGGTISIVAAGYSTNVAMISRYDADTNTYYPLVNSIDASVRTYTANITKSGYYAISYHTSDGVSVSLTFTDIWNILHGIEKETNDIEIDFVDGKYITLNGGIGTTAALSSGSWSSPYRYAIVSCKESDIFILNGTGGDAPRLWAFLDENDTILSVAFANTTANNLVIIAPSNTAKLVINDSNKSGICVKKGSGSIYQTAPSLERDNIFAAFDNIVGFGDSLTYSQVYTGANTSRQAKVPYPTALARLSGNTDTIIAESGADTSYMWNHHNADIVSKDNAIGIVYLGTNGGLTDSVSTDAAGSDPNNWANNNTGNYCRIVNKMLSVGYRVLLIRPWTTTGTLADTISAINDIAEKFGVAVMDAPYTREQKYHLYPDGSGQNSVHLNDFGYTIFAQRVISAVSKFGGVLLTRLFPNA